MTTLRKIFILLLFLFLPTLIPTATQGAEEKSQTSYYLSSDFYLSFSDSDLSRMLHLNTRELQILRYRINYAVFHDRPCDIADLQIPVSKEAYQALYFLLHRDPVYSLMFQSIFSTQGIYDNGSFCTLLDIPRFYRGSYGEAMTLYRDFTQAAEDFLQPFRQASHLSKTELALLVHDKLAQQCTFGDSPHCDTAYGALVEQIAICEGYTEAYMYLLTELGIPCGFCESSDLVHIWNIVKLEGETYNVDVTWDDTRTAGRVEHRYFLRSTQALRSDEHKAHDFTVQTTSRRFDSESIFSSYDGFCLADKQIYCTKDSTLYLLQDLQPIALCSIPKGSSTPVSDGESLFLMSKKKIYLYDPRSQTWSEVYTKEKSPDLKGHITGFYPYEGKLCMEIDHGSAPMLFYTYQSWTATPFLPKGSYSFVFHDRGHCEISLSIVQC